MGIEINHGCFWWSGMELTGEGREGTIQGHGL